MGTAGRAGKRYLRLCSEVRARREACGLCGLAIDYDAPPRSRWSFSLDHIVSLAHGGQLLDPANARAAHYSCNSKRGGATRQGKPELLTSRRW